LSGCRTAGGRSMPRARSRMPRALAADPRARA
jgi:hypothetical protein